MSKTEKNEITIGSAVYEITRVFVGKKTAAELLKERLVAEITNANCSKSHFQLPGSTECREPSAPEAGEIQKKGCREKNF